jgi:probable HAF family extracellular repeat protein
MDALRLVSSLVLSAGLVAVAPARAAPYTLFDLGTLGAGDLMYASGINDLGQVVGYAYSAGINGWSSTDDYRAFATGPNGAGLTGLGTLGGSWSKAWAINDSGQVVGDSQLAGGGFRGFIGGNGTPLRDLGTLPGRTNSTATGINASGQVIGSATVDSGTNPGFQDQWQGYITGANGQGMQNLGTVNGLAVIGKGINDSGQVVGHDSNSLLTPGAFGTGPGGSNPAALPVPMHDANAINNLGQIAGSVVNPDNLNEIDAALRSAGGTTAALDFHGVPGYFFGSDDPEITTPRSTSWSRDINAVGQVAGSFRSLYALRDFAFITAANGQGVINVDTLFTLPDGDFFVEATGINDAGQFIANTRFGHAYLISPIPEPATLALWAGGLLLIGRKLRRPAPLPA